MVVKGLSLLMGAYIMVLGLGLLSLKVMMKAVLMKIFLGKRLVVVERPGTQETECGRLGGPPSHASPVSGLVPGVRSRSPR